MAPKAAKADAPPTENETALYDGREYAVIKEGLASILVPPHAKSKDGKTDAEQQVFYNSIQQFNRDLTVIVIRAFWEEKVASGKTNIEKKNKKRKRQEEGTLTESANKLPKTLSESDPSATTDRPEARRKEEFANGSESAEAEAVEENGASEAPADAGEGKETTGGDTQSEQKPEPPKQRPFTILDALSASGLRALRYGHELPFVTSITANDLSGSAVKSIKLNVKHNKLEERITVSHDDATAHMYRGLAEDLSRRDKYGAPSSTHKYNVIDLDPYGTAASFLDAAVQSVREGGLLCVTCTDSAVWAGHAYCEKSYVLYGGIPVKGFWSHEVGLRLVLNAIATSAARYSLTIEPLLSLSIDYYVRVFVRVTKSQANLKFLASKTMAVYNCGHGCQAWEVQPLMKTKEVPSKKGGAMQYKHTMAQGPTCNVFCPHCKTKMHLAGPMYAGYLHSPSFIRRMQDIIPTLDRAVYGTIPRLQGMLQTALEEFLPGRILKDGESPRDPGIADVDPTPFYFSIGHLASTFQTTTPPEDTVRGALRHLGYRVTRSHCKPGSVKTNAPWSTVMWVMREWIRQKSPVRKDKIKPFTPTWRIHHLDKDPEFANKTVDAEGGAKAVVDGDAAPEPVTVAGAVSEEEEGRRKTLVFNDALDRLGRDQGAKGIVRYQLNPRENWGPMTKARGQ